jgi:signal transduction histidine kinase/CheY-like chemotaxis protein
VNGVLAFRKVKDLAAALEHQNQELDAQKRELTAQAHEVTEQNAELEMQKRQLGEANRLKNAFLSNMSHELRTPLNSVIALAGVLNRRLAKTIPEEEYGYLEIIERNGKSLLALINDILDLSRIEAGREDVNVSRFSIHDLVAEIVSVVMPQAKEKHIALHNEVPEDLPSISSDHDKCLHILQNLISNAVKFTEAGTVSISAAIPQSASENPQSQILISVTDTGIGIAPAQLPHIFDEFRQADDSTSRKYGGTGLGLAIATKYAQLLGGRITVQSTPGQGSTFNLSLPLTLDVSSSAREDGSAWHSAQHATPPPPHSGGQRLLLVEDSEPAVIQLTDILRNEGYRIHVTRNGAEALAHVQQSLPDALILDLMMPEVDGFEVLKAIRGQERTAHLPVLILTAKHVTKEELSFLKGNNIHQLIQKGDINKAGLLAEVARMVAPPQVQPADPLALTCGERSRTSHVEGPSASPLRRRPTRPGKPVVLVVEDNPDNLRTARALLADRYQVVEAVDGGVAVEQARRHKPDIILTDISLPVMDGIAVLAAIREDEALRATPVIAVTASAMKGDRETILAHGFDGYLSKPIDHDALMKTLQQMLD